MKLVILAVILAIFAIPLMRFWWERRKRAMKACRWCGIGATDLSLVPVWEKDIEAFIEHYVCSRCEDAAWEAWTNAQRRELREHR